ncbi:MAG: hypothetical protein K0S30_1563 [Clostridia bacterium]|jgi:cell wall-associated NlpC family hydrolase|nr:hypothetical protein [Clostridia bacterium]
MRLNKLLIMGIVSLSIMGTANAAVYGTIKDDLIINVSEDMVVSKDIEETLDGNILLEKGQLINIIEKQSDAYIIQLESDIVHTVKQENIELVGEITYAVNEETKLRENANPEADIIDFLNEGQLVLVSERQDDFYKVKVNDKEGYIYKAQIEESGLDDLPYKKTEAVKAAQVLEQSTTQGEEVVAYAKQFLGGRYVYGGNSLTGGVDCSGFTQQIMKRFGVQIERSSRAQYASNGYNVSEKEIQPGDLVFYGSNGRTIDHVAIYAGNGQIVHASDARSGIKMSALHYGKPLIGIKRVLN